jgi:hypothetical protein
MRDLNVLSWTQSKMLNVEKLCVVLFLLSPEKALHVEQWKRRRRKLHLD